MFLEAKEIDGSFPLGPDTKFKLGKELSQEQIDFLNYYGFVHFKNVATKDEVEGILSEINRMSDQYLREDRKKINGIPLFFGHKPNGQKRIQRFAFSSVFSKYISEFVTDDRFEPIRKLIGKDARVGEHEKDGVVINSYINERGSIYKRLGWHTDGLRDLFYLRMPQKMLNVGLHLDQCDRQNGGLRLIPRSQDQGFLSMLLGKYHFTDHREDYREICVETDPGDLTIHDGRLWHRVAQSKFKGEKSVRRTMYVPYLTGPYEPKRETSPTPKYHRWANLARKVRYRLNGFNL